MTEDGSLIKASVSLTPNSVTVSLSFKLSYFVLMLGPSQDALAALFWEIGSRLQSLLGG